MFSQKDRSSSRVVGQLLSTVFMYTDGGLGRSAVVIATCHSTEVLYKRFCSPMRGSDYGRLREILESCTRIIKYLNVSNSGA